MIFLIIKYVFFTTNKMDKKMNCNNAPKYTEMLSVTSKYGKSGLINWGMNDKKNDKKLMTNK